MNYVTQAIDGLNGVIKALRMRIPKHNFFTHEILFENDIDVIKEMQLELTKAVKFLLPKDGDVGIKELTQEVLDLVRMPYPIITFEYDASFSNDDETFVAAPKRVVLLKEVEEDGKLGMKATTLFASVSSVSTQEVWVPSPITLFMPYKSELIKRDGQIFISQYKPEIVLLGVMTDAAMNSGMSKDEFMQMQVNDISEEILNSIKALACVNAKNVKFVNVEMPEKLNKKRIKHGKTPYFEYKILDIFLGEKVLSVRPQDRAKIANQLKASAKLHSVRGHFKVRSTGIFWWSSFIRGKSEKGMVDKKYKLTEE